MKINEKKYKYRPNKYGYIVLGSVFFYNQFKKGRRHEVIPYAEHTAIIRDVFAEIWKAMVTELWRFEIPYLHNEVFIMEIMGQGVPTNWVLTKKKRQQIKTANLHTGGRLFKITMRRTHKSTKATRAYKFVPMRGYSHQEYIGKRGLAVYIKRCSEDPMLPDFRGHIC